ncbi:MAG: heme exporter protein CcmB [Pseudomonadota bacterium]
MTEFWTVLARDLKLAARDGGAVGTALGFYLIVVAMLPLGLGPDLKLLGRIAPGILWIGLLLSALLSLGRIFESDFEDGSLEVLMTGSAPLELVVAAKALAHWISTSLPLALLTPVLGLLLNLDVDAYGVLLATLIAGTPAISFLGSIGAALTLQARRGGLLVALLVLPLYIPTLIYGIATISAIVTPPGDAMSAFLILCALSLGSVVLGPIAAAAALRYQAQ